MWLIIYFKHYTRRCSQSCFKSTIHIALDVARLLSIFVAILLLSKKKGDEDS
ncbi:hypothetical protein X975_19144, partial [Stegodyphus mimosarum]